MPFEGLFGFHRKVESSKPVSDLSLALIKFFQAAKVNFFTDQYVRAIDYQYASPDEGEAVSDSFLYCEMDRLIRELKAGASPDDAIRVARMCITVFHDCIQQDKKEYGFGWVDKLRSTIDKDNPKVVSALGAVSEKMSMHPERRTRQDQMAARVLSRAEESTLRKSFM